MDNEIKPFKKSVPHYKAMWQEQTALTLKWRAAAIAGWCAFLITLILTFAL